jgi:hypothetical protein
MDAGGTFVASHSDVFPMFATSIDLRILGKMSIMAVMETSLACASWSKPCAMTAATK